jgi:phospholipid/cholesterol/gamma-HCH transport system substrate-binding protein
VTRLDLNPADPAACPSPPSAIDRSTPIRLDTRVTIDFQGLTGSPVIALAGGSSNQP